MRPWCLKAIHFQNCIIRSHSNEILKQFDRIFRNQRIRNFFFFFFSISSIFPCFSHFAIESSGLLTSWINFFSFLFYAEAICMIVSTSLFISQLTAARFGTQLLACMYPEFSAGGVLTAMRCCNYDFQLLILQRVA